MNTMTASSASTGRTMARMAVAVAPNSSKDAPTGFARPAVATPDPARSATVEPCTRAAAPPPPMTTAVHFRSGGRSPRIDALVTIPATTAAGVDTVSSRWSNQGM